MSGLYFARLLHARDPSASVVVLEKRCDRFGGRVHVSRFHGTDVVEGAAVARVGKDKRLLRLADDLGTKYDVSPKRIVYSPAFGMSQESAVNSVKSALRLLNSALPSSADAKRHPVGEDFEAFGRRVLGDDRYDAFRKLIGFTDYERAAVLDTVIDYGFEDNFSDPARPSKTASIHWNDVVQGLVSYVRETAGYTLHKGVRVTQVLIHQRKEDLSPCKFSVCYEDTRSEQKETVECDNVVFATTSDVIPKIAPFVSEALTRAVSENNLYSRVSPRFETAVIKTQPFLRVYVRVDLRTSLEFENAVKTYTVVPNMLQKVIPVDADKGVYMAAYSDNSNAEKLHRMGFRNDLDKKKNGKKMAVACRKMEALLREALALGGKDAVRVIDVRCFFWERGTHYYPGYSNPNTEKRDMFLERTLSPVPGVFVIGEGFSQNQGWTEGALERAENVVSHIHSLANN